MMITFYFKGMGFMKKKNISALFGMSLFFASNTFGAALVRSNDGLPQQVFDHPIEVLVQNAAYDDIQIITHNTEPLANVPGQELDKKIIKAKESAQIAFDCDSFAVLANRNVYYRLFTLDDEIKKLLKEGRDIIIEINALGARIELAYGLVQDGQLKKIKWGIYDMQETPKRKDIVEDALLRACGIERKEKAVASFARRFLRASVE